MGECRNGPRGERGEKRIRVFNLQKTLAGFCGKAMFIDVHDEWQGVTCVNPH